MIQRIQSVYLFIAAALLVVTMFFPVAAYGDVQINLLDHDVPFHPYGLLLVAGAAAIISLVNIFMFKNRTLQLRLCAVNIVVITLYYLTYIVYGLLAKTVGGHLRFIISIGTVLPAISLILMFMAFHGIKRDDDKVKAADRLR
jgi:hypothetical protein